MYDNRTCQIIKCLYNFFVESFNPSENVRGKERFQNQDHRL